MIRSSGSLTSDERDSTLALPTGLELLEQSPELILAAHGCVMFRIWRAPATLDSLSRCEAALDRYSAEHSRCGTLTVVERDVATPTPEVRQAAGRMMTRFMAQSANALVIEGTGFKHTCMRLAITTIHLLAPSSMPPSVFARVEEASEWLAPQLPEVSAALLMRALAALRRL
jgi:hypothetical protein